MIIYDINTDRIYGGKRKILHGWGGRLPLGFKSGELTATIKKGKLVFKEDKFYNHVTREYGNIIPKFRFRKPFVSMKQHCAILKLQRNYYRSEIEYQNNPY